MLKYLFVDRDGTLIEEPADEQVDQLEKFRIVPDSIWALRKLAQAGYRLVMVTNQDGLGTPAYPREAFDSVQRLLTQILNSQGVSFEAIRVCPHLAREGCGCRKPATGLLRDFLERSDWDRRESFVIGDRPADLGLAENLGTRGILLSGDRGWKTVSEEILLRPRVGVYSRSTTETRVEVGVRLDGSPERDVRTGIGFLDHLLEQLASHGAISLKIQASGDHEVDDHHTVEDVALGIGSALKTALGDKRGIGRYGFVLPMDDALAQVALDLSGRPYFSWEGHFTRDRLGDLSLEMVPHFFRSFSDSLGAALHIQARGENAHHQVEAVFKAVGRCLRTAIDRNSEGVPSTKGLL